MSPDPESLVAGLLEAEAIAADLAVFEAAYSLAAGGTCSLDTAESVRLAATCHRRLSEVVTLGGAMDDPTLAAVVRLLRDEYDAVVSDVEMVPLPDAYEILLLAELDGGERPFSEYKDTLRGMLEPYGVDLYVS